jgi:hypothetical protein
LIFEYSKQTIGDALVPLLTISSKIMLLKIRGVVPKILENIDPNCAKYLTNAAPDPISMIVLLEKEIASNLSEDPFSG